MYATSSLLAAALFLAFPLSNGAHADPYPQCCACDSGGQLALQRIEITPGRAAGTMYVDDENYLLGNGVWVYEETNGLWMEKAPGLYLEGLSNANLQRGGGPPISASPPGHSDPDICTDDSTGPPDTMLL
jgi:hypothetical protein